MIIVSASQFQVSFYRGVNARLAYMCLKYGHFQPGEGPNRGLLRDYEPSDGTFSSTNAHQLAGCQDSVKDVSVWIWVSITVANLWSHLHSSDNGKTLQ